MRFVPVSREQHAAKRLLPLSSYGHAAAMAATEVTFSEVPVVAAQYPLFFIRHGADVKLIALMGLAQGENLFVDSSGRWAGLYVPATIRAYPFMFGKGAEAGADIALLIDEESELLSDVEGEPLFGIEGEPPNGPVANAIQLLTQLGVEGQRTAALAAEIDKAGLLVERALNITRRGAAQNVSGILTVDEVALNALPDEKFLALRRSGGLGLAYAQLYSQGQLNRLQAIAGMRDTERGTMM